MGDNALGGSGTWAVDEVRVLEEQIAALKRERDAARDMREKDRQDGEANLRALEMHVRKELGAQVTKLEEELAESKRQCGRLEAEVRNLSDMRRDLSQDLSRVEGELRKVDGREAHGHALHRREGRGLVLYLVRDARAGAVAQPGRLQPKFDWHLQHKLRLRFPSPR